MTERAEPNKPNRLPRFRSVEEEAEFWDAHDSAEFEHLFRPTRVRFAEKVQHVLRVPLDISIIGQLDRIGQTLGIGPSELAAQLIGEGIEKLEVECSPPTSGSNRPA